MRELETAGYQATVKQENQDPYTNEYYTVFTITDCAVRPSLQERRGMSEANHSLSKCGDIRARMITKEQIMNKIVKLEKEIDEFDELGLVFSRKCTESELKELKQKLI